MLAMLHVGVACTSRMCHFQGYFWEMGIPERHNETIRFAYHAQAYRNLFDARFAWVILKVQDFTRTSKCGRAESSLAP